MGKNKTPSWLGYVAAGLMAVALFGCGGDDGATGPQGPAGPAGPAGPTGPAGPAGEGIVNIGSNTATDASVVAANAAVWESLKPTVTVTGVDDRQPAGGRVSRSRTPPASRWSAWAITTKSSHRHGRQLSQPRVRAGQAGARRQRQPEQVGQLHRDHGADDHGRRRAHAAPAPTTPARWSTTATAPTSTPSTATSRQIKDQVAAMTVTGTNDEADLGDLTYDSDPAHRLTIQISGNAPGTGTNTPTGATVTPPACRWRSPYDAIYDFIPATGQAATDATRARDRRQRQVQRMPPQARRHPGRRAARPGQLPASTAAAATTCSTASSATPTSASTAARRPRAHDQRCHQDLHQQHLRARRPCRRQPAQLHPQDPHGRHAGQRELQLRRRAC